MFGLFKSKSELDKLNEQYKKLMAEYHKLSTVDRKKADDKMAEAEVIAKKMDEINKKK
jgi:hypothetical protein